MQVDLIKPALKAPGVEPFKPTCDVLLSNFAFNFNLRHYTVEIFENILSNNIAWPPDPAPPPAGKTESCESEYGGESDDEVGRCRLTPSNPC